MKTALGRGSKDANALDRALHSVDDETEESA
jgi:hypothetical protein